MPHLTFNDSLSISTHIHITDFIVDGAIQSEFMFNDKPINVTSFKCKYLELHKHKTN